MDIGKRIPPHNEEAENLVIGAILIDNDIFPDIVSVISQDDFYFPSNKIVFTAISELFNENKPIDLVTISEKLGQDSLGRIGGISFLSNLAMSVATTRNAMEHSKIILEKSVRRQIIRQSQKIIGDAYDSEYQNATDIKSNALEELGSVFVNDNNNSKSLLETAREVNEEIKRKRNQSSSDEEKYHVGFADYDLWLDGLHPQELTIIAARPAVGKTSFGLDIASNLAKKGLHSVFITLEMSNRQLLLRLVSTESRINSQKLRKPKVLTDEEYKLYSKTIRDVAKWPIYIEEFKYIQDIRAYCRNLKLKGMLDVLFVDYIQLMQTHKRTNNRNEEIGDISRGLKAISKEFNIPVVALAQLSRSSEKEAREPKLSDLRESGDLEQDRLQTVLYKEGELLGSPRG